MYIVLLGFVYSALFLAKRQCQITFRRKFEKINIKSIKIKPPGALFKKKSKKLCFLLKVKSQNHKEKDVKKTVKRKIGKAKVFLKQFGFFLFEFQE